MEINKLEDAIKEQLGCESDEDFKQTLADVCRGGANAGFSGFVYSSELSEFFDANRSEILSELKDLASDLGTNLIEMVKGFNCLKDTDLSVDEIGEIIYGKNKEHEMYSIVIDSLCWSVLENAAFRYDS